MKIRVVGQLWFREHGWGGDTTPVYDQPEAAFWRENNFITIRDFLEKDEKCAVPVYGENILRMQFDDAVTNPNGTLILFNDLMAEKVVAFVKRIDRKGELFVNCAAGVRRSGAIGEVLNEYFNKYLENNMFDDYYFWHYSSQVNGNSLVRRLLRKALSL